MKNIDEKRKLDSLLEKHKAQAVGSGYIDIIVMRENYRDFVREVLSAGFEIETISWWEHVPELDQRNTYGMGGPISKYFKGWFAELCYAYDDLEIEGNAQVTYDRIIDIVENKVIITHDGEISFKAHSTLVPAFWLKVENDWENIQ